MTCTALFCTMAFWAFSRSVLFKIQLPLFHYFVILAKDSKETMLMPYPVLSIEIKSMGFSSLQFEPSKIEGLSDKFITDHTIKRVAAEPTRVLQNE